MSDALPPPVKEHLDHPEEWVTGDDPATTKQKGFIKVLEDQHKDLVPEGGLDVEKMGKSEASEVIDKLKNGALVEQETRHSPEEGVEDGEGNKGDSHKEDDGPDAQTAATSKKRKDHPAQSAKTDDASESAEADKEEETEVDEQETPAKSRKVESDVSVIDSTKTKASDPASAPDTTPATSTNGSKTVPGDDEHLDHPENWTTGDEPATEKQKAFIAVLEKQNGVPVEDKEALGKSEASEKIDELKA